MGGGPKPVFEKETPPGGVSFHMSVYKIAQRLLNVAAEIADAVANGLETLQIFFIDLADVEFLLHRHHQLPHGLLPR